MTIAAGLAAGLIGLVVVFQIALVLGAPWGQAAWGGQHPGRLPIRLRVASAVAIVILAILAWIVLAAAGLTPSPIPEAWIDPVTWVGTGYFGIGTVVNAISRSPVERLWAPVALLTAIGFGLVAAG